MKGESSNTNETLPARGQMEKGKKQCIRGPKKGSPGKTAVKKKEKTL